MYEYLSAKYKKGELDNEIIDITLKDIEDLYITNIEDKNECDAVTQSTYRNENYYEQNKYDFFSFSKEVLYRDSKTSGFLMQYPHGTIITQAERNHYYRGESQIFPASIPHLMRKLKDFNSTEEKETYKMIADMRIEEFRLFIYSFKHVQDWENRYSDVLYDALAQHYGLETNWLDITNDFNVALFFATCFYDHIEKCWKPLTKNETEVNENKKYGMIFHCPQSMIYIKNALDLLNESVLPIGFQPFMRCHMQNAYGIKMDEEYPLQENISFEKLRFRHDEHLSKRVYEIMDHGRKIYPHEGLLGFEDLIDKIKLSTVFSEEAFDYAFKNNNYFKDPQKCRLIIESAKLAGKSIHIENNIHPIHISRQRKRSLNRKYENFSIEKAYGIKLYSRPSYMHKEE